MASALGHIDGMPVDQIIDVIRQQWRFASEITDPELRRLYLEATQVNAMVLRGMTIDDIAWNYDIDRVWRPPPL